MWSSWPHLRQQVLRDALRVIPPRLSLSTPERLEVSSPPPLQSARDGPNAASAGCQARRVQTLARPAGRCQARRAQTLARAGGPPRRGGSRGVTHVRLVPVETFAS